MRTTNSERRAMPSKTGRGAAKRRVITLLCCLIAMVVVLARVQMAYAGAGGSIGGGGGGGWMNVFYKTVYVMDDSGFVQDGANPSQGWNKDSIDHFWNLLDNEVRTNTLPGYSPRVVTGGTTSNEIMYNAIDGNSKRWVDGSWAIPKKVFYALATQAIDRAAARAGTARARIVAFSCIYGGNSGTREWQFLNVSANLQAQNGFFYTLLPDGSPASLTLNDRVAPTGQLAKGLIPPEYMSGVTGTLWDTEAGVDASDGNIGSNPGESWRDYTYRRAVTDAGNALGTVAFIAVADNEPAVHNGSLTIGKAVTGQGASTTDAFKYDVHLTDSAGNGVNGTYGGHTFSGGWCSVIVSQATPVTIPDIPAGLRYTVTEDTTYNTKYSLQGIENASGTITSGGNITATGVNERRQGQLGITKVVQGEYAGVSWAFNVKVYNEAGALWLDQDFSLANGQTRTFAPIPSGYTYSVTEAADPLYDASIENATGTIANDATSTVTATNTRRYGRLDVKKVAIGTDGASAGIRSDARWQFNVRIYDDDGNVWKNETFWLARNGERLIERIPTTYTYTVTEDADDLYDTSIDNAKNYIRHNDTQTATATNDRRYGQLEVKKTARGTDTADSGIRPDESWEFRVMILDDDGRAWKDETFWLTRNETRLFERIPTTYTYRVFESEHPLYDSSSTGEAGVIANRETSKASFENQRRHGRLEVSKRANGTDASDSGIEPDAKWRFDVTIRDDYGNTWKHASFLLARDEVRAFEDIPTTYTYEVSESADSQYETTWNDRTGMIEKNTTSSCIATNRRLEGSFTVRKVVDRSRIADKTLDADRAFEIRVSLNDDKRRPVSGTFGEMTFVNGECVLRLRDGEVCVATNVPTDWTWGVRETVPDHYVLSGIENRTGAVEDNKRAQVVVTNEQLPGWALVNKVTR